MKVLVTGGCGFIGVNLCERLAREGHTIQVLDNLSTGREDWLREAAPEATVMVDDIRDSAGVARAVEGVDAVVHLAASPGVADSITDPQRDFDVNVGGMFTVLDGARRAGVRRFVIASTNAVVGPLGEDNGRPGMPRPVSPYGAGKLAAEAYCSAFHASYGMETLALRFANAFGPFSTHKTSVVAQFLGNLIAGRPVAVHGDGQQTRDFVFVGDICEALASALRSDGAAGQAVQVGSGLETSILELVQTLGRVTGQTVEVEHQAERAGDVRRSVSDLDAARRVLGYEPARGLEDGLGETWDWFRSRQS